jgi:ABC-2 type transport system permease protein
VLGRVRGASADSQEAAIGAVGHVGLASLFTLVLGVLAMTSEYQHRTITGTYLVTPRRERVLAAKLAVYTVAGLVFGLVTAVVAVVATAAWYAANAGSLDLSNRELWLTLIGGVTWTTLAIALGGALAWLALVEGLVAELVGDNLSRGLPFAAGSALSRLPSAADGLEPWAGGLVLVGYGVVFLALAHRWGVPRDVT